MQKHFIAGAICPKCRAMDKIVLQKTELFQKIECVSCGYNETHTDSPQKQPDKE